MLVGPRPTGGGTLVALSGACDYVTDVFNIPVSNALAKVDHVGA